MNEICYAGHQPPSEAPEDAWLLVWRDGCVTALPPGSPPPEAADGLWLLLSQPILVLREPTVIRDDAAGCLRGAFEAACFHYASQLPERASFLSLYGMLISCYLSAYREKPAALSPVVYGILEAIHAHLRDSAWSLEEHLQSLPFSYGYLRRLFRREIGVTPHACLTEARLRLAADALAQREGSVTDIAHACGFRDPLYFSRVFKARYGVAPSFYAQRIKDA